ncbi:MAG: ATP-binding cassette domain-containing protein [Clostridia bacterium]|nr:ATP-binding cassette domain-containing protein [Clostridia bacterium]
MNLSLEHLTFSYFEDAKPVVEDFSALFSSEEVTVLTGASGCGKSTLLMLASGLYPGNGGFLRTGSVTIDGEDPGSLPPEKRCRLVSMMFQNPDLQFCMDTVRNELIFTLENLQTPPERFEEEMERALDFCGISHLKHRMLQSLSGGEKQKVMLSCLVLIRPRWLLLDEPFANIDNESARDIVLALKRLHKTEGTGILAVDHRLDNWVEVADTLRVMEQKTLLPEKLSPGHLDVSFLEEHGIIVPGSPYPVPEYLKTPAERGEEEPLLTLKDLTVSYGEHRVLKGLHATFLPGHIYALTGPSGSGKSTLFQALLGTVKYKGSIAPKKGSRMGFVTQNPQDQFLADTVKEEIAASLKGVEDADAETERVLRGISLWRYRDLSPYLLSQGQQRRLGVAALMAYHCDILVCDEPTYAQDRNNTLAIMTALCSLAREQNIALIFSTHDPELARSFADEVLVLEEGQL